MNTVFIELTLSGKSKSYDKTQPGTTVTINIGQIVSIEDGFLPNSTNPVAIVRVNALLKDDDSPHPQGAMYVVEETYEEITQIISATQERARKTYWEGMNQYVNIDRPLPEETPS